MHGRGVAGVLLFLAAASVAEDGERLDRIEKRQDAMEERLAAAEAERDQLRADLERYAAREDGLGLGIVLRRGAVSAAVQIFGDVGFSYTNPDPDPRANSSFFFGGVNAFATARVGDHFRALSETVIKTSESAASDGIVFDQERLYGLWAFGDALYAKLGLEHGPVSRWNRLFHHGRWLELTIDRPLLARFEGAGGILPLHNAGLELGGRVETGAGRIEWVFVVSNGRGPFATHAQKVSDRNDDKALEAGVGFAPQAVEGLLVGVCFRTDEIPADPAVPARARPIRENVFSGYVEFQRGRWEALAELVFLEHDDRTSGTTFSHVAWYVQVGCRLRDRWTPYARFDARAMESGDPYFAPLLRDLDRWEQLFGLRHELTENAALKFEIAFGRAERALSGGGTERDGYTRIGFQLSWVF